MAVGPSSPLVDRAGSIGDVVLLHPLECVNFVAAVAAVVVAGGLEAGEQRLRRDVHIGPRCIASDFDPIRER